MDVDTKDSFSESDERPEREIEVMVSVTISKPVKIQVSDYAIIKDKDKDGNSIEDIDYSECDLKKAVEEQLILPHEAYKYTTFKDNKWVRESLKDWNIDDFEVILE